ncbi:hypothetical protein [Methanosarcina mazei]|uniref:hypothetical protein n=1 Tax=Methanosarcina mazei TaxID=2209 RepID=UPI003C733B0D
MFEISNDDLEWEVLQKTLSIEKITPSTNIPRNSVHIVVSRNDSYQIRANLTALDKEVTIGKRDIDKYSPVEPFTVEGYDQYNSRIKLIDCYINKKSSCHSRGASNFETKLEIVPKEVTIENNLYSEISWLSEWYLNGPTGVCFPRGTVRYQDKENKVFRKRSTVDISYDDAIEQSLFGKMDSDFAFIDSGSIKFLIARVPSNFGPSWSKNMCIEYRKDFGLIPSFEQRKAISEIVGFALGSQLLSVGFTEYDYHGRIIKSTSKSSWGGPYSRFISEHKRASPFNIGVKGYLKNQNVIEETLSSLVPKYLAVRDKLNLKDSLCRYWVSRNMPIGTSLPVLSGALEIVMKSWFKSENSKSKALYISEREFNKLLEENFKEIEKKLDDFIELTIGGLGQEEKEFRKKQENMELKKPIMNAIYHSNQMSLTKKYRTFFKEIGLIIGDKDEDVLKCRHTMAHPEKVSYEELEKMRKCTLAYETLFHRVFLKILGYNGNYIDRSSPLKPTIGYPERHIDMPLGRKKY